MTLKSFTVLGMSALMLLVLVLSMSLCGSEAGAQLLLSLVVSAALAIGVYRWALKPTRAGVAVLLVTAAVMSVGVILNVYLFTSVDGGTLSGPVLHNTDAALNYYHASTIYHKVSPIHGGTVPLLSYVTVAIWWLFGQSVVYPLALNVTVTLIAIVLSGRLAQVLLDGVVTNLLAEVVATLAMALTAAVCNLIGNGMVLLKEPFVYAGFTAVAIIVAKVYRGLRLAWRDVALFAVGSALLSLSRPQMMYFVLLALVVVCCLRFKTGWKGIVSLICVAVAFLGVGTLATREDAGKTVAIVTDGDMMQWEYLGERTDSRYDNYRLIVGDYFHASTARKVLLLPVTAAVQYVIPFSWTYKRDMEFGYSQAYNHFGYTWYALGGIVLFYYIFLWWRRGTPLRMWALWPLLGWLIVAFLYAGIISRYAVPFVPLMTPLAIVVVSRLKAGLCRTPFYIWAGAYTCVMAAGLLGCYFVQRSIA